MRSYRFKDDEVLKISTSVFVANFSDSFGDKDLWNTCKQYGHVVDAYIPYRRSKVGDTYNSKGVKGAANSYAHVVKGLQNSKMDSDSSPVMVLDDFCLNEKDYSLCLMGKIQLASSDFNTDGRVTWVEIEDIPLKMWAKEVTGWIPDFVKDNDEEEDSEVGSYEEVLNGEDVKNVEDLEGVVMEK
nr:UvrD-like helicase, ATP-binding domain, P-loop containing nucleoside triphosphate hydrolase [Tanacetum cinerariifolium]